ncbi:hypothetical protein [Halalkalibacter akibai]|nr:hypothetical protein [Halalkalibacter akibai]
MRMLIVFVLSFLLLIGCGPELSIDFDQEQTRIIYDESLDLISFYVRLENNGQLPANDLYARFIIDQPLQEAIGGIPEFIFTNSAGEPNLFQISGGSSYFIAEAFYLEAEIKEQDLINSVLVEIYDQKDQIVASHTIEHVTSE